MKADIAVMARYAMGGLIAQLVTHVATDDNAALEAAIPELTGHMRGVIHLLKMIDPESRRERNIDRWEGDMTQSANDGEVEA